MSADPIGFDGGLNLYNYVENNPITWIDPYGLLRTNPDGSIHYEPTNTSEVRSFVMNNGEKVVAHQRLGKIFTDKGTEVFVWSNSYERGQPRHKGMRTNCGGYIFTEGHFWVQPGDFEKILKDEYAVTTNPREASVVKYTHPDAPNTSHVMRIDKVARNGLRIESGKNGAGDPYRASSDFSQMTSEDKNGPCNMYGLEGSTPTFYRKL